jgi:hypothetical protein
MLFDGMKRAQLYIVKLIQGRRVALDCLFLGSLSCQSCSPFVFDFSFMRLVMIYLLL